MSISSELATKSKPIARTARRNSRRSMVPLPSSSHLRKMSSTREADEVSASRSAQRM